MYYGLKMKNSSLNYNIKKSSIKVNICKYSYLRHDDCYTTSKYSVLTCYDDSLIHISKSCYRGCIFTSLQTKRKEDHVFFLKCYVKKWRQKPIILGLI